MARIPGINVLIHNQATMLLTPHIQKQMTRVAMAIYNAVEKRNATHREASMIECEDSDTG